MLETLLPLLQELSRITHAFNPTHYEEACVPWISLVCDISPYLGQWMDLQCNLVLHLGKVRSNAAKVTETHASRDWVLQPNLRFLSCCNAAVGPCGMQPPSLQQVFADRFEGLSGGGGFPNSCHCTKRTLALLDRMCRHSGHFFPRPDS